MEQYDPNNKDPDAYYGLPKEVRFCKRCVVSNQRPNSSVEFKHNINSKKETIHFDVAGICDACRYAESKDRNIDWKRREEELKAVCDRFRRKDGNYDCIVPGSGGKDSCKASWLLKYKYGMHPLTVTWAPHMYTPYGWKNFQNWIHTGGFTNILFHPNGKTHRLLTKLAFKNLLHPFQPFILGQKNIGVRFALLYDIPLVFYGENEAEYGNPIRDNTSAIRDSEYHEGKNYTEYYLGGVPVPELLSKHGQTMNDLAPFLPVDSHKLKDRHIEVHYMGYYIRWDPQEAYYFACEHCGFEANSERTEGTYSKYNSIDDKSDPFHYWTTLIKFGIGRTTYDASQEIRNHKITREEGIALVKKFDQEFPGKFFSELLDYMDMPEKEFWDTVDKFRSPHIWMKKEREWKLRHTIWENGD